ncbi:MAG: histidine kinase, partial [Campylobacterota bacterium]|nr:histidine kinase [Campylobacterota bacterium]
NIAKDLGISSAQWPISLMLWPSGEILAKLMTSIDIKDKRILEVGCGIALSSLVLNKRLADITSTDYHPSVEGFLNGNTKLNNDNTIPFQRTNWTDTDDTLGLFDLIVGSDLLYEETHIKSLSNFINNHANKSCEVIIIDPGRGNLNKFTKEMSLFGFSNNINSDIDKTVYDYKGKIIQYIR